MTKMKEKNSAYYAANKKAIILRMSKRHAANPERIRAKNAAYYSTNREVFRAQNARYRLTNSAQLRAKAAEYYAAYPEKFLEYRRNRRARKRSADGSHTLADIAGIRAKQKDKCAYCRMRLNKKGQVDHIIALANGGSNWPANLQLLCKTCNLSKRAKDPIVFAQQMGYLL